MGILERLRRYFSAPVPPAPPALPNIPTLPSGFTPAYLPFKADRIRFRGDECIDQYPHWWGDEHFRSVAEAEWAKAFDRLRLPWEYEPLKFDMGPHFSYCPDFKVEGLIAPTGRDLYIEIKRFPYEEMPLTKYVKFTEWYSVDLLVLAHDEPDGRRRKVPSSEELLRPKDENYFIVMRCPHCGAYEWFPSRGFPCEDFHPNNWDAYWKAALACPPHTGVCTLADMEKTVAPNYFLIQAGTIRTERVVLPEPMPPTYSKS